MPGLRARTDGPCRRGCVPPERERVVGVVVVVQGEADLLQVVDALRPAGGLARRLDGGQEQGDQHGDDRDDHQQLDQGEGRTDDVSWDLSRACDLGEGTWGRSLDGADVLAAGTGVHVHI